jgi:IPT/TIG domain-containing protein
MEHLRDGRHRLGQGAAFFLIVALCAAPAGAQQTSKSHPAPVPRTVILPSKVVAGAPATLAVLDAQGRLLPNATVELSGGEKVKTNATGRALFKAPTLPGTLVAKISGRGVSASTPVVSLEGPGAQPASEPDASRASVRSYPRILAIRDRFTIEGSGFRGEADSNRIFLADQLCFILASSPSSLVVLPGPRVPIGDVTLRVIVDGRNAGQFPISAALLDFSGPAEAPNAGSVGKLTLRAHGTAQRLIVEIRNASPDVIQLLKGNPERVVTTGGEENIAPVDVKFLTAGNYAVTARLISAESGKPQPDVDSVRKHLLEARGLASGIWSVRIDRLLLKIDSVPLDLAQIRADLKSLLDDRPDASLASLLDSAWRELQQNN